MACRWTNCRLLCWRHISCWFLCELFCLDLICAFRVWPGDTFRVVFDTTCCTSTTSCLIVTMPTSHDDGGWGKTESEPPEFSDGSCFTLTRSSGTFDLFFPSSSCLLSASTRICFCLSILVSSCICWSFSFSILSLSKATTGPVEAPGETRRRSRGGVFLIGN